MSRRPKQPVSSEPASGAAQRRGRASIQIEVRPFERSYEDLLDALLVLAEEHLRAGEAPSPFTHPEAGDQPVSFTPPTRGESHGSPS